MYRARVGHEFIIHLRLVQCRQQAVQLFWLDEGIDGPEVFTPTGTMTRQAIANRRPLLTPMLDSAPHGQTTCYTAFALAPL